MASRFRPGQTIQVKGRPDITVYVNRVCENRFIQGFYGWPVTPTDMGHEAVGASPYKDEDFEEIGEQHDH